MLGVDELVARGRDRAPRALDLLLPMASSALQLLELFRGRVEGGPGAGHLPLRLGKPRAELLELAGKPLERRADLRCARPYLPHPLADGPHRLELAGDRRVVSLELRYMREMLGGSVGVGAHEAILARRASYTRVMKTCASCGTENPDIARFCLACGSQLADAPAPQETRKVVTIVFSDLKGSTSLGEALDSEALREVMTRYFDAMRGELERHGGVIEKFIGDAVMAVFGLPRLHEDDALRAVRAAAGMQAALEALNVELDRHYGVQLSNRTGVNTGEVVSGDASSGQRLVTGDAVNVAARLEQAAGEREVLLGELTYRLVRDSVEVVEVEPLALKGKAEPVPAYRLVGVKDTGEVDVRRGTTFVGRDRELEALEAVFRDAVATRSARLATLVADAGVGKSRLTAEFLDRIADGALVLAGRCLPYGDGITFWPLAEALKTASGIVNDDTVENALAKLAMLTDRAGADVTERLAAMIGLQPEPFPVEELAWATRRLLEHLAAERPVALVVEDVHWAEPTLLELIEQLVEAIDEVPVLVLCPARPVLLDERPDWGTGDRATRIELEPLDADASRSMVENLLGGAELEPEVLDHVVAAAEGNPLFAEQLVRMLVDEGVLERRNGTWHAIRPLSELHVPPDDPGAPRRTPRHARRRRARGDRARLGRRLRVRGGCRGGARTP